ncbi:MAG: RNA 2',3'-cyclic phosphodiesterase [Armatimonadetes bacterium]|nr:RNA 2',3'-cyclic phosphodiesterase [Armatimonadota bacterium]
MRLFLAMELDESIRTRIHSFQQILMSTGADVKWVRAQNLHLTLKFLGEVDSDQAATMLETVRQVTRSHRPFEAEILGVGAFPKAKDPRTLWVGIRGGSEQTLHLYHETEAALEPLGLPREKKVFSPHITVGRCRSMRGSQELLALLRQNADQAFGVAPVRAVTLFQSQLTPNGPVYTSLGEAVLEDAG